MPEKEIKYPDAGTFIVADILPPTHPDVRAAAHRSVSKKKTISVREKEKNSPIAHTRETNKERVFDAWFQKGQTAREPHVLQHMPAVAYFRLYRNKNFYLFAFAVLLVAVGVGGYGISYMWSRLDVNVFLKTESRELDLKMLVAAESSSADVLAGERINFSDSITETFKASGTDSVRSKAKGIVTIYNAFNTSSQTLVAHTRLEAPDGKMYRIQEAITVPPAVMENGTLSPRSVDVTIYADKPGPEYNRGLSDFTIPGFKGSPRFQGFYARSKTPLEGGYIGTAVVITKEDIDAARESLASHMQTHIIQKAKDSVPEGFWLLDDAVEITTDSRTFSREAGDVADEFSGSVAVQARALVFQRDEFVKILVKKAGFDPANTSLRSLDSLSIVVERRNMEVGSLALRIKGSAVFVWKLDTDKLANELAEIKTSELESVFQKHDAIQRAETHFVPSWIRTIPRDPSRVRIHVAD